MVFRRDLFFCSGISNVGADVHLQGGFSIFKSSHFVVFKVLKGRVIKA
jgi:hypothetical protein